MFKKLVLTLLIVLFVVSISLAEVPQLINYQGFLSDASGNPIDGLRSIQFSLFGALTGGTAIWSETHSVQVNAGLFDVMLGSVTPFGDIELDPLSVFLEIKVADDPPMTPRKQIVSVPFAFEAGNSEYLEGFSAHDFVRRLNDVSPQNGNINLVAGSNVTITPDAGNHRITIAASGGGGAGDNLGNHTATQNIRLNGNWLSNDGGNEGIQVGNNGDISVAGNANVHGSLYTTAEIQTNTNLTAVTNIQSNGGYIRTGTPTSTHSAGDVAATDDVVADDQVVSGGNMSCGDNLVVEHHAGINMGGGYSTTYALQVNGDSYSTEDIIAGDKIISGGHVGVNFGGYSATYALRVNGSGYATTSWLSSDIKFKTNIAAINTPLSQLMQLRGVTYNWNKTDFADREFNDGVQHGLIAQEVEKVFPGMVMTDENGEKAVAYYQLIPVLLEALKQQQAQIEALQQRIDQLGK